MLRHVESTLGNGLGLRLQLVVSSKRIPSIYSRHTDWRRALTNSYENSSLRVYITGDGSDVYEDAFMDIAKPDGHTFRPTLILVATRLGLEKITPVYWEALKSSLQMPQSIGIAGYVKIFIFFVRKLILVVDDRRPRITLLVSKDNTFFI